MAGDLAAETVAMGTEGSDNQSAKVVICCHAVVSAITCVPKCFSEPGPAEEEVDR